jgi:8-amino-7-oxononanoate synthase
VSNHLQLEQLRYVSHPYIFTASPSPATIASTRAALELLRKGSHLRDKLWSNCRQLYSQLKETGYKLGPDPGPVIAAVVETPRQALLLWQQLLEHNIYVNLILPPAAPEGKSLVRCSVNAAHTMEQIKYVGDTFAKLYSLLNAQK